MAVSPFAQCDVRISDSLRTVNATPGRFSIRELSRNFASAQPRCRSLLSSRRRPGSMAAVDTAFAGMTMRGCPPRWVLLFGHRHIDGAGRRALIGPIRAEPD